MFRLHADKVNLSVLERETVTTGSVNVYPVRFTFSQDWNGLDKTAVFRCGAESRSIRLGQDGACVIPWEVLTQDAANRALYIGVYGVRDEAVVLPTVWANVGTVYCGASPGEEASPPTPGLYEQIVEQFRSMSEQTLSGAEEILTGAETAAGEAKGSASSAAAGAAAAREAAGVANAASRSAGTAAEAATKAVESAEESRKSADQSAIAAGNAAVTAQTAEKAAQDAARNAAASAEAVQLARQDVSTDREAAEKAAEAAETAQSGAQSAKTEAEKAAEKADLDRQAIENLSVEARTLEPGSPATVEMGREDSHVKLTFGLPQGEKGQSAYQQAVSAGLSATEPEFNSALAKVVDAWSNWHYDLTDEEMSDPDIVYERTRPVDWLKLPELDAVQDGEFWLLFQWLPGDVTECSFTMRANSDITVEAGRYENSAFAPLEAYTKTYHPANASYNVTVPISLDSADFSDLTSEEKVQAVVRINGELTNITLNSTNAHFVDGIVRANGLTVLSLRQSYSDLTYFAIADMSASATSIMFYLCNKLVAIRGTPVGFNSITNGSSMFRNCYKLLALPNGITFTSIVTSGDRDGGMFGNCYSLKTLPPSVTFSALQDAPGMFANCYSLKFLPKSVTFSALQTGSSMFSNCYSLSLPPSVAFSALQGAPSMFANCYALQEVPNGLQNLVIGDSMFSDCRSLRVVPPLLPNLESAVGMFLHCYSLRAIPTDLPNVTNCNSFLNSTYSITALYDLYLPAATSFHEAFISSRVSSITGLYIPSCSNLTSAFSGCNYLEELTFSPEMTTWETPDNISLSGTRLSHAAILALFESLPTISTPKTVTLTGTPGASQVTAEEAQIATGKGWLLAGIPVAASDAGAEGPEIFPESAKPDEELTELTEVTDYIDRKIDEAFAARGF